MDGFINANAEGDDTRKTSAGKEKILQARKKFKSAIYCSIALLISVSVYAGSAQAHCDAKNGPVAIDAQKALETGTYETAAKWVGKEQNQELRNAYEKSMAVYKMGGKAKDLAQQYFIETTVRLHRQAEGFAYSGLKPAKPLPPDIAAAEKSLDTGNLEPVQSLLASEMQSRLHDLFKQAMKMKKNQAESLSAGRKWADAYVRYITFVHGLFEKIQSGPTHGVGD